MPAGTLTLTNKSAVVKGTGTAFNTELKAGDFIVSIVGGVTYTLPVKTVDSATQATLIKAYDGPTQAGAAWYAVPRDAMNTITAQLAAETAKALRGLNLDKDNWQQVFSGTGNITVTLPDGSTYTGPAWNSFTAALNLKADKTEVDKKANKSDLGNSASRDVGTAANTVAAGNDNRLGTINGKTGGLINGIVKTQGVNGIVVDACTAIGWDGSTGISEFVNNRGVGTGGFRYRIANQAGGLVTQFEMRQDGSFAAPLGSYSVAGRVRAFSAIGNGYLEVSIDGSQKGINFFDSDETIKEKINPVEPGAASAVIRQIRPVSYKFKDTIYDGEKTVGATHDFGVIAQEIEKILPNGVTTLSDGKKSLNPLELFGLLLTANKEMLERIDRQDELIKLLKGK
ncbi:tail fiber domain-containing protein [Serratia ureilytica]|uniref:tail fiber domain-containing protein n=2 Tax=Serratia ureilytica TaxID=300181 RepID=UPI0018E8526C|nr:tail fiber domain-containing protein [Serratia ureilytica]MBJ2089822.1 tail fiber domain-containing protein [Serratia ureilytica]